VLIAQAVFLLERGQTDRETDATEHPTTRGGGYIVDVGNYYSDSCRHFCNYYQHNTDNFVLFLFALFTHVDGRQPKRDIDMVHYESWKPIYFGVKGQSS